MNRGEQEGGVRGLMLSSLRGRGRDLRSLAAWSLVEAVPAYLSGRLVARAIDRGFLAGRTTIGFAWLGVLGVSVIAGAWGTRQIYRRLASLVEPFRDQLATLVVNGSLYRSVVPGAPPDTAGVARLTQHVEIVREAYASLFMVVQTFLVTTVGTLVGLFTLFPPVLVLVLPPLVLGLGLFLIAFARVAARQRASILADERIAETGTMLAGGLRDVVACGAEELIGATVGEHVEAQAQATRQLARLTALRTVAVSIGGWVPLLLILVAGPWLVRRGATVGVIFGALTYVAEGIHAALETLVRGLANTAQWLIVTSRRILEVSALPGPSRPELSRAHQTTPPRMRGDVLLEGVTFGYGRHAEPVIRELDLIVPGGDHLAVVGPSGVGKSTLAGIMTGILEPNAGEVRISGVPLRELDGTNLADLRVLIPQEAYVFAGSIRENLVYLRPDATDVEIDRTVARLGVRPLVERIGGYDAELRPAMLSAGERQLITLVRAYLSTARLIVLDEATCHLDPAAEARVEKAFARRPGTLLVIAHRISSALRARRVLLLDGAEVLLGTHGQLLRRSRLYGDLVGRWQSGDPPARRQPSRTRAKRTRLAPPRGA